ncbi:LACTBL1 [Branchiostoma lanceolatum]|uniref:LACTBL1 protein n=1 Tax=Branchiostoma lanceolatum TaxID=7740 RepID=A0A8J9ZW79_BRALA|nr:LACTBL1 [Branchiostoma lanceolatum]
MGAIVNTVLVVCFMIVGQALTMTSPGLQQRLQDLDTFIQTLMTCESRPVVGLTVSVVKDGQTIFAKGYGQRDLETGQAVDNRTLFGVGSISKSFTSALLASILGEREDVSWDTVLTDILGPSFRFRDQFRTKEVTLRDLLTHKTGLENQVIAITTGQDIDRSELARRIRYYRQVYPFRTFWYYNNPLYTLAGHVAEKLTGKSYEALLRERILQPLGMDDTVYLADALEDEGFSDLAQAYMTYNTTGHFEPYSQENFRTLKLHLPAGGVVSNALDMARYMKFHLSGGRDAAGRAVVPEDTLRQTYEADFISPRVNTLDKLEPDWPVEAGTTQGYGLGWFAGTYRGYKRVQHSGFVAGFASLLSLYPAASGGVYTSVNGPYTPGVASDIHEIIHALVGDILTGKDHWLNATTACTYPEPWWTRPEPNGTVLPEISDNFPRDKRDYEGVYGNHATGNLTISLNATDDKLYFSLGLIGRGLVLPTDSANRILLRSQGPLAYISIIVADVGQRDGKVFSLSLQNEPPGPAALFERGLKMTDPDPTEPQWDDCVSGSPERGSSSKAFAILVFLAYVYCFI